MTPIRRHDNATTVDQQPSTRFGWVGCLFALTLLCGCNGQSPPFSDSITDAATRQLPGGARYEPAPLQRTAPPSLIQLTEFAGEPTDYAAPSPGPQLVLPQTPAACELPMAGAAPASFGEGEVFTIVDKPTHPQTPATNSQPAGTTLPWGPSTPSPELTAIAQRAEQVARRGYDLAERGGLYSARAKFTEALRMLAEALDVQRNTTAHTKALAAGLRALEEVDDFVPRGMQIENSINFPLVIDAHRTPVLKDRPLDGITPLTAQRMYLVYAQEQLAMAGGDQAVASLALHGLGKICTTPAQMHGPQTQLAEAKAVVYFQAAVIIEPRNFMSANELGVLLVRFGRLSDARQALEQAVAASDSPTTWKNLAIVNERLGDPQKATICRQRSEIAVAQSKQTGANNASSQYQVRWVDPATFAQSNSMVPDATPVATQAKTQSESPEQQATAAKPETKPSGWRWPWQ